MKTTAIVLIISIVVSTAVIVITIRAGIKAAKEFEELFKDEDGGDKHNLHL